MQNKHISREHLPEESRDQKTTEIPSSITATLESPLQCLRWAGEDNVITLFWGMLEAKNMR